MLGKVGGKVRNGGKKLRSKTVLFLGRRTNGECGLFPEAYVEEGSDDAGPPNIAPPPLPQDYSTSNTYATPSTTNQTNSFGTNSNFVDDWNADPWSGITANPASQQHTQDWQADVS